jgi:type II secretory pathway component PulJ
MCEPSSIGRESECGNQTGGLTTTPLKHLDKHNPPTDHHSRPRYAQLGYRTRYARLLSKTKQQHPHISTTPRRNQNAQGDTTNKQHKPTTNTKHPTQTHTHPRQQPNEVRAVAKTLETDQIDTHHKPTHYIHWGGWLGRYPGTRLGITIF